MPEPEKINNDPLASEMYHDLKHTNKILHGIIIGLFVTLSITILGLIGTHVYHIYQWSTFDAVVVDTSEGSGNANYVQGDNTGGIYNGENRGSQEEGQMESPEAEG